MGDLILLIINAALVNNLALIYLIGMQDQISFSKRLDIAWLMSIAIFFIASVSILINYIIYKLVISPLSLNHFALIIYMLNIFLIVQITHHFLKKMLPLYQQQFALVKPLILLNTVIIAGVLLSLKLADGFFSALFFGLGTAIGFALVLLMFTCLRERIQFEQVPVAFRELPILLITLAIMSMAFTGFTGIGA